MLIRNSFLALAIIVPASATALETTTVLDLVAGVVGVDGDVTGQLAVAAAVLRQPTAHAERDSAPSPHKNADLGALTLKQRQATSDCPESCLPGFFGYCDGARIGPETCGEDCCVGYGACFKFTGCVKGDGSCSSDSSGEYACYGVKAPFIENSCKGNKSCELASFGGAVKDSCNGVTACQYLAHPDRGLQVGTTTQSCNGVGACRGLAMSGVAGSITQSCNGAEACYDVAYKGEVGPMTKSCNRDKACTKLAYEGKIASITKTCNNDVHKPCAIMPGEGTFGHMINRVHIETGKKYTRDSIAFISDCMVACQNDDACNGIKWKEHTGRPCRFFGGAISENPCNGRNVCITALQA